jgi:hypothetical protein
MKTSRETLEYAVLKRHLASLEKRGYISRIDMGNTL